MSPIPSVVTAFAISPATPSASFDPDPVGQSTSAVSRHSLATGGLVFAVAAIVSVAGYFYHGRGSANGAGRNNTRASWTNFLSSIRHRGAARTSPASGNNAPKDLEGGFEQNVSMVYARCFRPTSWKVIECHPPTASAPAIYVEDEGRETPALEPKPYGTHSSPDMCNGDGHDTAKDGQETATQVGRPKPERASSYTAGTRTNVRFNSKIIGATVRVGGFLSVPGQCKGPCKTPLVDSEPEFTCSPYDGIVVTPPGSSDGPYVWSPDTESDSVCSPYDGIVTSDSVLDVPHDYEWELSCLAYYGVETTSNPDLEPTYFSCDGPSATPAGSYDGVPSDSRLGSVCSPYDEVLTTPSRSSHGSSETLCSSGSESVNSPCDGISTTPPKSTSSPRRYGMVDMQELAQNLKLVPESGYELARMTSFRGRLCDICEFVDPDSAIPRITPERLEAWMDNGTNLSFNGADCAHDSRNVLRGGSSNGNTHSAAPHEGVDLMRRLLEKLRDPDMDCCPRALSEDTYSQNSEDEPEEGEGSVPPLTPTSETQHSPESTGSHCRTDENASDEGTLYPLTPPSSDADVHKAQVGPPVTWFNERMRVVVVSPPSKAYVRSRSDGRILVRGRTWLPYLT